VLATVGRRVFIDIDPGFAQFWHALGLHDAFAGHDAFATVGLNVGRPATTVPACGLDWVPTLPPVCLDRWPASPIPDGAPARVTSVCTWRGPFAAITYGGQRYGLRVHELRRFAALPSLVPGARFELALDIDPADEPDAAALRSHGWTLVDPKLVAADPGSYRGYLQASSAELMVAKELYVASRGGWFSDRSACYLASGRPVVAQDTGWSDHLPAGEGLLGFSEPAETAAAVAEVCGNPSRHAKAAREIAAEHFDAARVLGSLLDRLGLPDRGWS